MSTHTQKNPSFDYYACGKAPAISKIRLRIPFFSSPFLCLSYCFCIVCSSLSFCSSASPPSLPVSFLFFLPSCGDVSSRLDCFLLISSPWVVFVRAGCAEVKTSKTLSFSDSDTPQISRLCVWVWVWVRISTLCFVKLRGPTLATFYHQVQFSGQHPTHANRPPC